MLKQETKEILFWQLWNNLSEVPGDEKGFDVCVQQWHVWSMVWKNLALNKTLVKKGSCPKTSMETFPENQKELNTYSMK